MGEWESAFVPELAAAEEHGTGESDDSEAKREAVELVSGNDGVAQRLVVLAAAVFPKDGVMVVYVVIVKVLIEEELEKEEGEEDKVPYPVGMCGAVPGNAVAEPLGNGA